MARRYLRALRFRGGAKQDRVDTGLLPLEDPHPALRVALLQPPAIGIRSTPRRTVAPSAVRRASVKCLFQASHPAPRRAFATQFARRRRERRDRGPKVAERHTEVSKPPPGWRSGTSPRFRGCVAVLSYTNKYITMARDQPFTVGIIQTTLERNGANWPCEPSSAGAPVCPDHLPEELFTPLLRNSNQADVSIWPIRSVRRPPPAGSRASLRWC